MMDITKFAKFKTAIDRASESCVPEVRTEFVEWGLLVSLTSGQRRGCTGYTWEAMTRATTDTIVASFNWFVDEFCARHKVGA